MVDVSTLIFFPEGIVRTPDGQPIAGARGYVRLTPGSPDTVPIYDTAGNELPYLTSLRNGISPQFGIVAGSYSEVSVEYDGALPLILLPISAFRLVMQVPQLAEDSKNAVEQAGAAARDAARIAAIAEANGMSVDELKAAVKDDLIDPATGQFYPNYVGAAGSTTTSEDWTIPTETIKAIFEGVDVS